MSKCTLFHKLSNFVCIFLTTHTVLIMVKDIDEWSCTKWLFDISLLFLCLECATYFKRKEEGKKEAALPVLGFRSENTQPPLREFFLHRGDEKWKKWRTALYYSPWRAYGGIMKSIALANPQALFAHAMCFFYTWSSQGSCGVVPGPLLVFPIAPLDLWTTRNPHTSHDTRSLGRREGEWEQAGGGGGFGGFRDNRAFFVVPYLHALTLLHNHTSSNKRGSLVPFMPFSSSCFHDHADKWESIGMY